MTTRILKAWELERIAGSDLALAWPQLPSGGSILVCEDDAGEILGHVAVVPMLHVEGFAIAPSVSGLARGAVFAQLETALHAEARRRGQHTVFPAAADARMVRVLERLQAVEIPARWFALTVKES